MTAGPAVITEAGEEWAGGTAGSPSGPFQQPSPGPNRPAWRRPLPILALVVVLVVVAVAVPFAVGKLRNSSGFSSLPAASILSKSIVAANSVSSFEVVIESQDGSQSAKEILHVGRSGGTMFVRRDGISYQVAFLGSALYLRGSAGVLEGYGVSTKEASRYAGRWVSAPAAVAPTSAIVRALVATVGETRLLALHNVTKMAARPEYVELRGQLPASPIVAGSATGTDATLNVSTTAPYLPVQLYFSDSEVLTTLTYSHWGDTTPVAPPRGATPLATLLAAGASGTAAEQAMLRSISLGARDLRDGYGVQMIPGGNEVKGQVTLDLCNQRFATERLRIARLQVTAVSPAGEVSFLSTEAVLYSSPGATARAFGELEHVAAHCPSGYVVGPQGPPANKTTLLGNPAISWPLVAGVQRLAYKQIVATRGEPTIEMVTIFLRRGRVLLGLYFQYYGKAVLPASVHGYWSVDAVTHLFEDRLAGLPATAVR